MAPPYDGLLAESGPIELQDPLPGPLGLGAVGPLPAGVVAQLRSMMPAVVSGGTSASSRLPRGVSGRSGAAQAASGEAHAWFVGYRGDLAFAVFVEHGGTAEATAVPVAAHFLAAL